MSSAQNRIQSESETRGQNNQKKKCEEKHRHTVACIPSPTLNIMNDGVWNDNEIGNQRGTTNRNPAAWRPKNSQQQSENYRPDKPCADAIEKAHQLPAN